MSLSIAGRPLRVTFWKIGIGVILFVATALVTSHFMPADKNLGRGSFGNDLMPSYIAGSMIRHGQAAEIYNPYAMTRQVRQIWLDFYSHEKKSDGLAPWLNPPFYALVFVPLAGLSYPQALGVWMGINAALTVLSCWLLIGLLLRETSWSIKGLIPLGIMTAFPFLQAEGHQQNTFLSLAILSAAIALTMKATRRRASGAPHGTLSYFAGIVGGLLLFKPQLGVGVAIILAAVLGYRALIGAAITGTILLAMGEWAMPGSFWAFVLQMPETVRLVQDRTGYTWPRQTTLMGFWRILIQGEAGGPTAMLVKVLWGVSAAGLLAALLWPIYRLKLARGALWRDRSEGISSDDFSQIISFARRWLAAAICVMPLVMPYYMDYDLLLLAAAAVLMVAEVIESGALSRTDRGLAWMWVGYFLWLTFQPPFVTGWRVNLNVVALASLSVMMIARIAPRHRASDLALPLEQQRLAA
jgi:hypothetical protein